jgi:translocation and assembly module TamA
MGSVIAASRQGVPETYLFRTGGTNSLRGFAFQALGIQEAGAVVGAKHMALVSLDWTYWFKPSWGLALFSDAASVFDRLEDVQVRRSIGVGGRWRGPLGPVQIDIAKAAGQSAPRLHFSLSIPI